MKQFRLAIPLAIFLAIATFLWRGLYHDPHEVPSPLIGKAAPPFDLAQLQSPDQTFDPRTMRGKVWLLNVWASWCIACREEHPYLLELSKRGVILVGLNYKDDPKAATQWLERLGNPYALSVSDRDGHVGIDYGVYGAPETFVIDKNGIIRYKQIGPITPEIWAGEFEPILKKWSL